MLSFVVPAHNEQAALGATLDALLVFTNSSRETSEIIVVDDGSTDETVALAHSFGIKTISVKLRHIAAVRNVGAAAAHGDILLFVDADTIVPAETIEAAIAAIRVGAVGGGARVRLDASAPFWSRAIWNIFMWFYHRNGLAAGCFLFVRRDAFQSANGFDEKYFATEEIHLSRKLKSQGRFVIVPHAVTTSARKFHSHSAGSVFSELYRIARKGWEPFERRHNWWYGLQREPPPRDENAAAGTSTQDHNERAQTPP